MFILCVLISSVFPLIEVNLHEIHLLAFTRIKGFGFQDVCEKKQIENIWTGFY
jgi:hypothetical protein